MPTLRPNSRRRRDPVGHRTHRRQRRGVAVASGVLAAALGLTTTEAATAGCVLETDLRHEEIAFVSDRDGDLDVYLMRGDGSALRQLTYDSSVDAAIDWSHDGRRIAFTSDRDGNPELYVMDHDGGNVARLTDHPSQDASPSWSADGRIVFHSNRTGDYELYVVDPDDPDLKAHNLTNRPRGLDDLSLRTGDDVKPAWSPDGALIAFESYGDRGVANPDIWVMDAAGGARRRLAGASTAAEWFPTWSPDGSAVAYMSSRNGNWDVYVASLEGVERPLLTTPKSEYLPSWTSDGRALLFGSNLHEGGGDFHVNPGGVFVQADIPGYVTFEAAFDLYAANIDGSCLTRLTRSGSEWNPRARPKPGLGPRT